MTDHLDPDESRTQAAREAALFERFGERLAAAAAALPGLRAHLAGHDLAKVDSRADLVRLPVLRKAALMEAQRASPPFGGFVDGTALGGSRVFMSPGPVFEAQRPLPDPWASARALYAAGFRAGTLVHNAFSYHLTPGAFILEEGARALGCTVFPAGVGNTDMQIAAIRQFRPSAFVGTPDYLRTLLDRAAEDCEPPPAGRTADERRPAGRHRNGGHREGRSLDSIERALVSGGALFPAVRQAYADDGISVLQCYATADVGVIAYESPGREGGANPGLVVEESLIVELCEPGSGEPVRAGERGEVVVTRLDPAGNRPVAPLVRFATGDLSAWLEEPSPCGRTNARLAGWLGRADQRTKVRGMFVDPEQVQAVRRRHPEVTRVRLVVTHAAGRDIMTLRAQAAGDGAAIDRDALTRALGDSLKRASGLAGEIELVDELPADGVVVEDARDYESGA